MGRVLGVDWGGRRVGLALSDPSRILASPLPNLVRRGSLQEAASALIAQIKRSEADLIVIGQPYYLDGSKSPMSLEIDALVELLLAELSIPYILWDERLTTTQADRHLKASGLNRKKRAQAVDSLAAVIILQSYLDRLVSASQHKTQIL